MYYKKTQRKEKKEKNTRSKTNKILQDSDEDSNSGDNIYVHSTAQKDSIKKMTRNMILCSK